MRSSNLITIKNYGVIFITVYNVEYNRGETFAVNIIDFQ